MDPVSSPPVPQLLLLHLILWVSFQQPQELFSFVARILQIFGTLKPRDSFELYFCLFLIPLSANLKTLRFNKQLRKQNKLTVDFDTGHKSFL